MKLVVQRVSQASVTIGGRVAGSISRGLLVLVGFTEGDGAANLDWMVRKLVALRVFGDDEGKMNLSVTDIGGEILVVSQFTLYGDTSKGNRPSFVKAAHPDISIPLYESFVEKLSATGTKIETGEFGAMMDVSLVNDGPVTIVIEK
jgi:D-tyrosyl-tRNA(Tyr) deacylase